MSKEKSDRNLPLGLTRGGMLSQLMANISDNIYFKDSEGRIVFLNSAGARWYGFESPKEVIGKTDFELFSEEHAAAASSDEQRIMATGEPIIGIEERETRRGGSTTWASTTKMPLRDDDGRIVGTFGISRDITARKEQELTIRRLKEQMESELQLAREIQRSFLEPQEVWFPESATGSFRSLHVVHEYRPSGPVGGDFYCLLPLSETCVGLFIADVMGHGVAAALMVSALNAVVRNESARFAAPPEFLEKLNTRLRSFIANNESADFITAFYMIVDTTDGSVRYSNAGHNAPVVLRAGSSEPRALCPRSAIRGPALMLFPDASFKFGEDKLNPGDRLLLFTDGLTEMPSSKGSEEELQIKGLLRLIDGLSHRDLPTLVPDVIASVLALSGQDSFDDDVCLIGVEYCSAST